MHRLCTLLNLLATARRPADGCFDVASYLLGIFAGAVQSHRVSQDLFVHKSAKAPNSGEFGYESGIESGTTEFPTFS
jgi:hypothetical protein